MANDGLDLARPPVNIHRGVSRHVLATRMRGTGLYSMGAGGFAKVPAFPMLQRLTPKAIAANPQSDANIRLTELYAQKPQLFKARIASMFSPGKTPNA